MTNNLVPRTRRSALCGAPLSRGPSRQHALEDQIVGQVTPVRVKVLDQLNLPGAPPPLHRMFSRTCFENRRECFEIHELIDPIFSGKARNEPSFVLGHASDEIVGNADIERSVASACENVDEVRSVHLFVNRECAGSRLCAASLRAASRPGHELSAKIGN